ncbi:MAG: hypothetical protein R6X16_12195 [Anaerolineae bacterium]
MATKKAPKKAPAKRATHSSTKLPTPTTRRRPASIELRPSAILIVGALGGRLDQTLANLSILTDPALSHIDIRLEHACLDGPSRARFVAEVQIPLQCIAAGPAADSESLAQSFGL